MVQLRMNGPWDPRRTSSGTPNLHYACVICSERGNTAPNPLWTCDGCGSLVCTGCYVDSSLTTANTLFVRNVKPALPECPRCTQDPAHRLLSDHALLDLALIFMPQTREQFHAQAVEFAFCQERERAMKSAAIKDATAAAPQ